MASFTIPRVDIGNLTKTDFRKSQTLSKRGDIMDVKKPSNSTQALKNTTTHTPADTKWLEYRNKVLRFDGYFQEAVHNSATEQYRIRGCTLLFFPEDDTLQVNEKCTVNSGMPQGTLLRRDKVLRSGLVPTTMEDFDFSSADYIGMTDFKLGEELTVYGRTFKLTDCDAFTRQFLRNKGILVGEPYPNPSDPHTELIQKQKEFTSAKRPYEKVDTLGKFLAYDRKVLRFYCLWDDTASLHGEKRFMVLHYYLANDTIELVEILPPNSGRTSGGAFFGRNKLPKDITTLSRLPGDTARRTVLNTLGDPLKSTDRHLLEKTNRSTVESDASSFYTDADLQLGSTIQVLGRTVLLCDCDEFTKNHYRQKYGVEEFATVNVDEPPPMAVQREVPPPTGYGTDEDSMVSVQHLVLSPPKKQLGRHLPPAASPADGSLKLRFLATMDSQDPLDAGRKFTITYFVEDDTISVFEQTTHNSGIRGGKFAGRGRYKTADKCRNLSLSDFSLGGKIEINAFKFVLEDADEYAVNFMKECGL